jgi:4'-phosphopantetheinyl transferase
LDAVGRFPSRPHTESPVFLIVAVGKNRSTVAMTYCDPWNTAMSHPQLGDGEVHVWRSSLIQPGAVIESFQRCLSEDEILRAERFRPPKLREKFIAARGTLRLLLSRYLQIDPAEAAFAYSPLGKPSLAGHVHAEPLCFNLSHSGDLAMYAFALRRQLGVDVERHRPMSDLDGLVKRFFSAGEQAALGTLPKSDRIPMFFRYWTLKEAYLKARGTGLSFPLNRFEVTLRGDAAPTIRDDAGEAAWSCRELPCEAGYAAAIAAEGQDWRLRCWQMPTT